MSRNQIIQTPVDSAKCIKRFLKLNDGVKLTSNIWVPKGEGPWPALVMRQPYDKKIASTVTYSHPTWWANQGYLVIIQDVRGQGESEGEFGGFKQESTDTNQTYQWVRSLKECNGLLGSYGFSYQGLSQLLSNPNSRPPECLAPAMTGLKECEHWSCEGNAFWWDIGISWGLQLAAQKLRRDKNWSAWEEIMESLESKSYLRKGSYLLEKYDPKGMAYEWLKNSDNQLNQWRSHEPQKAWLKKPMLLIGGWWDPHLRGILDLYQKSKAAGGNPDLHIGPASHLQWWKETNLIQLEFFNKHLKNHKNKDSEKSKISIWNLTTEEWDNLSIQTEAISDQQSWFLSTNGLCTSVHDEGKLHHIKKDTEKALIVHDPWRPVPSIGGHLSSTPGKVFREDLDNRGDVATFTSDPLEKDILLKGFPTLKVNAKADTEGFDLCIALSIIHKDSPSKVEQIATGVNRVLGQESKTFQSYQITLQPILALFPKGSQLRLSIAGSCWPAIAINPGTTKHPCRASTANCLVTTIWLDLTKAKLTFTEILSK